MLMSILLTVGYALMGAGIGAGLVAIGAGLGIGRIGGQSMEALIEVVALFAAVICLLVALNIAGSS